MTEMSNAVQLDTMVGALQDVNENRLSKVMSSESQVKWIVFEV